MKGVPIECRRLFTELISKPSHDTFCQLKELMNGEGRIRRANQWRGPFAWSILMAVSKADLIRDGDIFGQLSWMACEIIHILEGQLTLKFLDYEKLLCNLASKFLDSQQVLSTLSL